MRRCIQRKPFKTDTSLHKTDSLNSVTSCSAHTTSPAKNEEKIKITIQKRFKNSSLLQRFKDRLRRSSVLDKAEQAAENAYSRLKVMRIQRQTASADKADAHE